VALNTHPYLAPRLKKEQSCTSTPPLDLRGLFEGKIYLYLYLYLLASGLFYSPYNYKYMNYLFDYLIFGVIIHLAKTRQTMYIVLFSMSVHMVVNM